MSVTNYIFSFIMSMVLVLSTFTSSYSDNTQITFSGKAFSEDNKQENFQITLSYSDKKFKLEKTSGENPDENYMVIVDEKIPQGYAYYTKKDKPEDIPVGDVTANFFNDKDKYINKPDEVQKEFNRVGKIIKTEAIKDLVCDVWEINESDNRTLKMWYSKDKQFVMKSEYYKDNHLDYILNTDNIKTNMKFAKGFFDINTYVKLNSDTPNK